MMQETTCLFNFVRFEARERYNSIVFDVVKPGGMLLPLRLFNPSKNKRNKDKLQSFADAVGVESFESKDEARSVNMILGKVSIGHPINVVWQPKLWINRNGDDTVITDLVEFKKFEGIILEEDYEQ